MNNHSTLRYFIVVVIILILLSVCFTYIFSGKIPKEKPYQTLTPVSYEKGTTVDLYKNTPPNFPKEIVLENKTLDYSGSVSIPGGNTQTTVSYISSKNMQDVVDMYTRTLPSVGWIVTEKSTYTKVSVIKATKGTQIVLITIAPVNQGGVMVTFQYKQ